MRTLAATLLVAVAAATASADDKKKDADKAKDAAVKFLKAVNAKDLDAVMKTVGAPFLHRDGDKAGVVKDEAALKVWMKARLAALQETDKLPLAVEGVEPFADARGRIKDAADLKVFDEVVGKDGFAMTAKSEDGKLVPVYVRIKDGKAVVVGYGR